MNAMVQMYRIAPSSQSDEIVCTLDNEGEARYECCRLLIPTHQPILHSPLPTLMPESSVYQNYQITFPNLQLSLRLLQSGKQEVSEIPRRLIEVEAHPLATKSF